MAVHDFGNVLGIGDLLVIDSDDQVTADRDLHVAEVSGLIAAVEAGVLGSSAREGLFDEDSILRGEAHLFGEIRADGKSDDPEGRTAGMAVLLEIAEDSFGGVDG